jgi:hypothetical protein
MYQKTQNNSDDAGQRQQRCKSNIEATSDDRRNNHNDDQ